MHEDHIDDFIPCRKCDVCTTCGCECEPPDEEGADYSVDGAAAESHAASMGVKR
jgi:hypothetical protein